MKCRFNYIDNNIKNKRFADKLTNICIQTWKELINSNLFRRKNNSLFFSKLSTINRQKQEELISLLNSKHNATIIFNDNDKVVVDVSELFSKEPVENNDLQNTDIYKSFVKRIYDNYEKTGIIQQYTNDLFSTEEIVGDVFSYAIYLDTIFPDSKVIEMDNSLYISVLNQLEQENKIEKDCSGGKLKAEKGLQTNFTKGGKWEIFEIFEGKSHKQGGIDINIKNNQISFTNKNGSIKAKYGLVISKDN